MPRTRRRALLLVLAASTAAALLAGCVQWFLPPAPSLTSQPTGEEVAPELAPFYEQVLQWSACGKGLQCATAAAPLDWKNPADGEIDLALVRHLATGQRVGSLLVNPGGPGGSGVDFVTDSLDFATSDRLQAAFDVVGFDPRGVGQSSAVSCYDDPAFMDTYLYGEPPTDEPAPEAGSDAWIAEQRRLSTEFADACLEHTGPLLQYVDTISAARDLDLLRAILGDEKLNYLGYSYGTALGATYASLYPEKTGRLVLDGAIDPATSDFEVTKTQAVGFESAFRAYLEDCVTRSDCPFDSVDEGFADTGELLTDLNSDPLPGPDGRWLWGSTLFTAIILPLYSADNWPYLDDLFVEVRAGQTATAFLLADFYNGRDSDGTYLDNSTEAFISINCLDYAAIDDPATMRAEAAELAKAAPVFGPVMSYGGTLCGAWPFPATGERGPITAAGSADILVVGTTNDPATPYVWAEALASQLEKGHLVTFEGEGHTAYPTGDACVQKVVDDFLVDGVVPTSDPRC